MEIIEDDEIHEMIKFNVVSRKQVSTGWRPFLFQTMIFVLTYVSYAALHFTREGWSILKTDIEDDVPPGLDWEGTNNTGLIDFFFLFSYSFGLFISGVLGDNYPIRIILPIGYLVVAVMVFMVSMGGTWRIDKVYYYIVFFAINGLFQSIGWPSYISIMGNWFSQESRGLVFGFWCTCQNVGNIGGNILVNLLRDSFDMTWMWSFRIISIIVTVLAVLNFILLIDNPK
jgi:sugar phosphate permease